MTVNRLVSRLPSSFTFLFVIWLIYPFAYAQTNPPALEAGKAMTRELAGLETHTYTFALPAGQFLSFNIEQRGIDVVVRLIGPGGKQLAEVNDAAGTQGTESLQFITETPGVYSILVAAREIAATRGRYEISLKERRPVAEQDRQPATTAVDTNAFEQLLSEANQLRSDYSAPGMRKALEKYQAALALWRAQRGAAKQEAEVLKEIAATYAALYERYREKSDRDKTLEFYQQSIQPLRTSDRKWEAFILYEIGRTQGRWRELPQAIESYQQALALSRELNDSTGAAAALVAAGQIYVTLGQIEQGLAAYEEALNYWRAANDRSSEAGTLNSVALAHNLAGNNQKALEIYQQALALRHEINDRNGQITVLNNLAVVYRDLGELQRAIDTITQVFELSQQANDQESMAFAALNIGSFYDLLGQPQKALDYFQQALPLFKALNLRRYEGAVLNNLGKIYYTLNDKPKALDHHKQALLLIRAETDPRGEAAVLINIARLTAEQGDRPQAIELLTQALTVARTANSPTGQAGALNQLGRIYQALGEPQKALEQHRAALPLALATGNPGTEAGTRANIARVESELSNLDEARAQIEAALQLIESIRSRVASQELRTSYFASVQSYYDFYIELLMRISRERKSEEHAAAALHASERARARGLLELLTEARANIREGVDAALLERERDLQQRLTRKVEEQIRLLSGPHNKAQVDNRAKELEQLKAEYQDVQTKIRQNSPRYAALTQPQPLTVSELQQQVLDADTLLLEYALGAERSYLWAVTQNSITSFELPKRAEIEAVARRLLTQLTARNQFIAGESKSRKLARIAAADAQATRSAAALSRMVLQPAAAQLNKKRLLIVADGVLQYVPFSALPITRGAKSSGISTPLFAKHEIISLPSASTLAVLRREMATRPAATRAVAVLADPVFDPRDERLRRVPVQVERTETQPATTSETRALTHALSELQLQRLPYTAQEAEEILRLVSAEQGLKAVGFQATRAAATGADLSQYQYVHFATHGYFNSARPEMSGLVFSRYDETGRPQNGFLLASDVYNLRLPAEVVVLSACETGLGEEVRGEGLIGLTRGFMYAGAARVVVSLWSISDQATADLMSQFYRNILQSKEPQTPAAALRAAQLALWRQKRWNAPYYWAAFTLQGEYR
jgi:CHAT domain-containing protein